MATKKIDPPLPPLPGMIVKPFMSYADVWKREKFDKSRMAAYKVMENEKQIEILKVTYSKTDGLVVIEYRSVFPHEWVIEELKDRLPKIDPQQLAIL